MHDESLNKRSFAKRASPRKDRLPMSYGTPVFCHTCQTNQMLISNLLSNYLPSPDNTPGCPNNFLPTAPPSKNAIHQSALTAYLPLKKKSDDEIKWHVPMLSACF
ncbi:uncharacterized protein PHACADRAFT_190271 [Phanerochaete carnosa HHB-10118-sp]|uniref:Ima1 N-terminal domain-containing protein n=1 Tax=Phanerochaete carnosa (strain HHB-10118-sp) TaxID=650164 RepID=K5XDM4_PHACS|nr:uncharacterized protein PHACADRAFT_190271 [Phanerochaete carnosa HHB-10118-sp]EKM61132.1 hypothetical protein PHACADRAFT_190271 [Phanerochaete carnosa HHB-10118-sp]